MLGLFLIFQVSTFHYFHFDTEFAIANVISNVFAQTMRLRVEGAAGDGAGRLQMRDRRA